MGSNKQHKTSVRALKQGQLDRTRRQVLDAAIEVLSTDGYRRLTKERLAEECGVARSTINRHWKTIPEIAMEAFLGMIGPPPPLPQTGNVRTDLTVNYRRLVEALQTSPWGKVLPAMLEASLQDEEIAVMLHSAFDTRRELGRQALQMAVDRGELPDSVNFEWLLDSITGAIYHRLFFTNKPLDEPGMVEYWVNSAVDGAAKLAPLLPKG